ncbi:MAG: polysaccharide deacetylase family protein [Armatimonadota bacterium]|nr:polysaccharide deacetylase family protein [Armatimonadota bacterium]MCX7776632.1 polysaccharide deacetylase family protein [Armatimonadota bacterium]MDW8025225.1 polysaccharide deacetylase family protein [Armatimonadota bacterium]
MQMFQRHNSTAVWLPIVSVILCMGSPLYTLKSVKSQSESASQGLKSRKAFVAQANCAIVLMYHRVNYVSPNASAIEKDLTVSPKEFERQVRYLIQGGFKIVRLSEIEDAVIKGLPFTKPIVAITFDDGYIDNYEKAFPILRRYSAPATIFLVTDTVGTRGHLSWEQIKEMKRFGIDFGSHSVRHLDLTRLKLPQLDFELRYSKARIEQQIGDKVTAFAYPAGEYNSFVIGRVKAAGYKTAWRKSGGAVTPSDNPFALPRLRVSGNDTLKSFEWKLSNAISRAGQKPAKWRTSNPSKDKQGWVYRLAILCAIAGKCGCVFSFGCECGQTRQRIFRPLQSTLFGCLALLALFTPSERGDKQ